MKFSVGDLVRLKNEFMQPSPSVGVVLDYWPVEHSEHGYIYHIVSVRFGSQTLDLSEEDFELVNKIVQKKVDKNTKT
tara:strand:+ start:462 stop:692 length:231 start_codon:yes stop_codon:yes gene_type:complete